MSSPSSKFSVDGTSPSSPNSTRSGYPFPESLPRQSASNKYHPRRGSTASNTSISSIGGSLDTQNRRGSTVRETSQNAISTLLQPPIVRTGLLPHTAASTAAAGYRAPTTKDIPPVALTNIPHIPPENFRDYLNRIGPLFESFQRGRSEPEQPQWLKKDKELEKTDRFAQALERRMSNAKDGGMMSPTTPLTATLSPLETPGGRRRSSANPKRNRNEPTPLSIIPNVYFDENFHLENPRTFDVVSERAEIVRPPPGTPQPDREKEKGANGAPLPPRKALATNAILQEKLSWYMDTVEVHLINNISTASSGFFAALGSLKELQTEAEESVAKIQRLRADLRRLDQEVAVAGLEVAAKRRRRANLGKLGRAMGQVGRVVEEVKRADEMVEGGEFEAATEQMDRVGRLVCGQNSEPGDEEGQLIDLRPLRALQGLDTGLQELQLRIGTGFANRFTSFLLTDLRQHVEKVPSSDTLKRWSRQRGIPPTYLDSTPQFRADLLSALRGLQRAGHILPATTAYREAVTKEMKAIIRKYLPSSNDDDADSMVSTATAASRTVGKAEKSSILARNLRALEGGDAERLLVQVYTDVGEALRRVSTQTKVLLDVSSSMLSPPPESQQGKGGGGHSRNSSLAIATGQLSRPGSSSGIMEDEKANAAQNPSRPGSAQQQEDQALDLSSLLGLAVDTAQTQITRVLKVRNEATIRLPPSLFLRYFTLNRLFADECEAISGRGGQGLKGIINAQIQGFVQVLGHQEMERIRDLLEGERWEAEDFGEGDGVVLQRVLGSMGSDPPEWGQGIRPIWEDAATDAANGDAPSLPNGRPSPTPNGNQPPPSKAPPARPAYIDGTRYILVPSARALLPSIETFLSLTTILGPSLTPQIATALLDVLRTFNSRSCQLILGAGATRSAGLKNITTKHLALASQALSFVGALVPYVRECVRRHLGSGGGGTGGVLAEFDKMKRLLQEHQAGIHEKLVEIMTGRSGAHVKALLAMDFSSEKDEGKASSAYMETLTKETLTLHRVLGKFLHEGDLFMIMRQIGEVYRGQWIKAFGEVDVRGGGEVGEKRLLRDAETFESRLGKIEGLEGVGKDVVGVVKARMEQGRGNGKVEEKKG
ncbi:hypothetical protein LTR37_019466 [Vermiconidia calcicola]|uniref:Uncharacterized protein n=1 Tax=Vermiconidia calcicola TaxID=1690605 RepID=A0ACC3MFW0_9PEZI|nr:hypothetical protein LTR37_019466 [Vermiconidia calcicola]